MNNLPILIAVFLITFFFIYTLYFYITDKKAAEKIAARINSVASLSKSPIEAGSLSAFKVNKESLIEKKINQILSTNNTGENILQLKLYRCGIKFNLKKIILAFGTAWLMFFSIAFWIVDLGLIYDLMASFVATIIAAYSTLNFLEKRRRTKFINQLGPAVDIILRGIRAGSSVEKTFLIVARELKPPLKEEFQQITKELEFGIPFDKVMRRAALRINVPDFYFFSTALIIQRKSGGSLSDVLENIINTLSKVQEIRMKINVYSSEAKTSGYVLACIPAIIWVVLLQFKPEHIEFFNHDPLGKKLFLITLGLFFSAFVVIKRLINLEV